MPVLTTALEFRMTHALATDRRERFPGLGGTLAATAEPNGDPRVHNTLLRHSYPLRRTSIQRSDRDGADCSVVELAAAAQLAFTGLCNCPRLATGI